MNINKILTLMMVIVAATISSQGAMASSSATIKANSQVTPISDTANLSALEVVRRDPSLSIMVEAIEASGLSNVLRFAGDDYTIFAPNNEAFNRLFAQTTLTKESLFANKEAVRVLLAYHTIKGDQPFYTHDLNAGKYKTYSNRQLTVTSQGNLVDGKGRVAHIVRPNIMTDNGVVHVIDNVMFPLRYRTN